MNETPKSKHGWRILRRILITLAVLATLVAVLYAEEDWRGKRAWENCKHELEAKGAVLDWDKFIPPTVPDDQNFFKAPKMEAWFMKGVVRTNGIMFSSNLTNELTRDLNFNKLTSEHQSSKIPVTVAELVIEPGAANAGGTNVVLRFDDPAARERAKALVQQATGPSANGPQGFFFVAKPLNQIQPAHIVLQADKPPTSEEVAALFPADTVSTNVGSLRVKPGDEANSFYILLAPHTVYTAEEYLQWCDQAAHDFDLIREALKRPYARMDGDYSKPYEQPIPNFIEVRVVAQTLASRAQCYLLLGQPENALREMTLLHDMCRLLEGATTSKPMSLVSAMINVAVTGLYVNMVADGLQRNGWQEPQMAVLQEQLKEINLTPFVLEAFRESPARICRNVEIMPLYRFFSGSIGNPKWTEKAVWWFWPSGWTYQNMVNVAVLEARPLEGFDLVNDTVAPHKFDEASREVEKFFVHNSPYKLLAAIAIPNITKATQVLAYNQTMINEAQIACALERYRLAHGEYPGTLDALAPQFIEKIPHDLIGGQPLIYRPTADGKFLLYSIGWNETDDGGEPSPPVKVGPIDYTQGDWVWKN
jgi:hypothetical protein